MLLAGCDVLLGLRDFNDPTRNCVASSDPSFHDEDADGLDDRCDNCPGIANPLQEDVLEAPAAPDGVGDACDPHPYAVGDVLVDFVSFHEAEAAARWQGDWTLDGENLVYSNVTDGNFAVVVDQRPPPTRPFTLAASVAVDGFGTVYSNFNLAVDLDASRTKLVGCGLVSDAGSSTVIFLDDYDISHTDQRGVPSIDLAEYKIVFRDDPAQAMVCSITGPSSGATAMSEMGVIPPVGSIGFDSQTFAVHVHWLAIYQP
jgi:hypothetical protein